MSIRITYMLHVISCSVLRKHTSLHVNLFVPSRPDDV